MQKIYSIFYLFIGIGLSFAQQVQWQKDFPVDSQDLLTTVISTPDQQYLLAGSTIQLKNGESQGYDFHILKLDQQGKKLWDQFFGGTEDDFLTTAIATQEGGFVLAGSTQLPQSPLTLQPSSSSLWIIKLSEDGREEWQKTLGDSRHEIGKSIAQTTDLGYVVACDVQNFDKGFGSKDVWLLKLDKNGKISHEIILGGEGLDEAQQVIPTKDGGVLLAVYTKSNDASRLDIDASTFSILNPPQLVTSAAYQSTSQSNQALAAKSAKTSKENKEDYSLVKTSVIAKEGENFGVGDFWIVKLNKDLKIEWQKNFGGVADDQIRSIRATDSGYIIGGESRSEASGNKRAGIKEGTDLWLISLDEYGEELWQQSYNFGNRDVLMSLEVIRDENLSTTKGYLIGGYTQAEEELKENDETFWMLYLDTQGKEVWRKYVEGTSRKQEERLSTAFLNREGNYILAGTSGEELGKENWKIVKLGDQEVKELLIKQEIRVYPNPVEEYTYVEIGYDFKEAEIQIYDMSGKMALQISTSQKVTKIDTHALPQGVFILVATTQNPGKRLTAKIIKK